jgi:hypothetical protein
MPEIHPIGRAGARIHRRTGRVDDNSVATIGGPATIKAQTLAEYDRVQSIAEGAHDEERR